MLLGLSAEGNLSRRVFFVRVDETGFLLLE
jgi:hypothetical protein